MSLITKILTALRGGAREVGESIVDKNSIRIFEQEIKDAQGQIDKAKRDLTEVMAKEMQAARKVENIQADIIKHEDYVGKALADNNETLALEIAEKIGVLQAEADIQQKAQASFENHTNRLKGMIKKTTKALADMERQFIMVKTTDSVQKATAAITDNYASGSSKLLTAKESLDRIKEKQADLEDRLSAGEILQDEFDGTDDLDEKMKAAGIIEGDSKAQDILAKLKAKQG